MIKILAIVNGDTLNSTRSLPALLVSSMVQQVLKVPLKLSSITLVKVVKRNVVAIFVCKIEREVMHGPFHQAIGYIHMTPITSHSYAIFVHVSVLICFVRRYYRMDSCKVNCNLRLSYTNLVKI